MFRVGTTQRADKINSLLPRVCDHAVRVFITQRADKIKSLLLWV